MKNIDICHTSKVIDALSIKPFVSKSKESEVSEEIEEKTVGIDGLIQVVLNVLDARDPYTFSHSLGLPR